MKWLLKGLIGIFISFLILAIIIAVTKDTVIQICLERAVSIRTGLKLQSKKFNVGIFNSAVSFKDLILFNPEDFEQIAMLEVPDLFVDFNLRSALKRKIHIEEMRVDLKEITVIRNEDGELNLDSLYRAQQGTHTAKMPIEDVLAKLKEFEGVMSMLEELDLDSLNLAENDLVKQISEKTNIPLEGLSLDVTDIQGIMSQVGGLSPDMLEVIQSKVSTMFPGQGDLPLDDMLGKLETFQDAQSQLGGLNLDSLSLLREGIKVSPVESAPSGRLRIDSLHLQIGKITFRDYFGDDGSFIKGFNLNIDEKFTNVTDPKAIISQVMIKAIINITMARLNDFDLGGLEKLLSGKPVVAQDAPEEKKEPASLSVLELLDQDTDKVKAEATAEIQEAPKDSAGTGQDLLKQIMMRAQQSLGQTGDASGEAIDKTKINQAASQAQQLFNQISGMSEEKSKAVKEVEKKIRGKLETVMPGASTMSQEQLTEAAAELDQENINKAVSQAETAINQAVSKTEGKSEATKAAAQKAKQKAQSLLNSIPLNLEPPELSEPPK